MRGTLKSYEEIIAMSADNAVAELNTNPAAYYEKLNSEGHIVTFDSKQCIKSSGASPETFSVHYSIYYNTGTNIWIKFMPIQ